MIEVTKDPDEVLDFGWDWADEFAEQGGDTIATATWTVEAGLTKDSETNTTTVATVWLSGGTIGVKYRATCRVVTAAGRTYDRTLGIVIEAK